jgi:hypothetical protein
MRALLSRKMIRRFTRAFRSPGVSTGCRPSRRDPRNAKPLRLFWGTSEHRGFLPAREQGEQRDRLQRVTLQPGIYYIKNNTLIRDKQVENGMESEGRLEYAGPEALVKLPFRRQALWQPRHHGHLLPLLPARQVDFHPKNDPLFITLEGKWKWTSQAFATLSRNVGREQAGRRCP